MSIFKILEELYERLPNIVKAGNDKLKTIRKWIQMYFNAKKGAKNV